MKKKQIMSWLLVFVMALTIFPTNWLVASAYSQQDAINDNLSDPSKFIEYELVFMEDPGDLDNLNPNSGVAADPIIKPEEFTKNQVFAVGIRVKNLRNLIAAGNGIKSLSTALIYDSSVLLPEPDTYDMENLATIDWSYIATNMNKRIQQTGGFGAAILNDRGRPVAGCEGFNYPTDGSTVAFAKPIGSVVTDIKNAKIYSATADYTNANGTPQFPQGSNYDAIADDFIIGVFRFAVINVPEPGTKVLEFGKTADAGFSCVDGNGRISKMFYPVDQVGNWSNSLTLVADVDDSLADLFPNTEEKFTLTTNVKTLNADGTVNSSAVGGTVTQSGNGKYEAASSVTATATAKAGTATEVGYKFLRWEDADGNTVAGAGAAYTFNMPAAATTLTAVFQQKESLQCSGNFTADKNVAGSATFTVTPGADYTNFVSITLGNTDIATSNYTRTSESGVDTFVLKDSFIQPLTEGGTYTINVTYGDGTENKTVSPVMTVTDGRSVDITSVEDVKGPTEIEYTHGETLDLSGLSFVGKSEKDTAGTKYTYGASGWSPAIPGDNAIKITIDGTEVNTTTKLSHTTHNTKKIAVAAGTGAAVEGPALTVNKKALSATVTVTGSDTYNQGTAIKSGTSVTPVLTGVVTGETVSLTIADTDIEMTNKNAGTNKALQLKSTYTPALTDADAGNYTIEKSAVKLNSKYTVNKVTVLFQMLPVTPIHQGGTATVNMDIPWTADNVKCVSGSSFLAEDKVNILYTATYKNPTVATSKSVTIAKPTLAGDDAGNYEVGGSWPRDFESGLVQNIYATELTVVTPPASTTAVYGSTFNLDGLKIEATHNNGVKVTGEWKNGAWTYAAGNPIAGDVKIMINGQPVTGSVAATWDMKDAPITVEVAIPEAVREEVGKAVAVADVGTATVTPKPVNVTLSATGSKVYDATNVFNGKGDLDVTAATEDILAGDATMTLVVDKSKVTFADQNAGTNKAISAAADAVSIANNDGRYTLVTPVATESEAAIEKKTITVTGITGIPTITRGSSGNGTVPAVTQDDLTFAANAGLEGTDTITLTYDYTYAEPNVVSDDADVSITGLVIKNDSANKDNYKLSSSTLMGKGVVNDKQIDGITITTQPKLTYTYGDVLDMSDLWISAGGEPVDYANHTSDFRFEIDGQAVADGAKVTFAMTGKTIKVIYGGKSANTDALTINKLQLTATAALTDSTKTVSKVYDGTTALPDGITVADFTITPAGVVDGDTVTVTAKSAVYADKNAAGSKAIKFELELAGEDAANYIVPEDATGATGEITKKPIKIVSLKVKAITQNANATVSGSGVTNFTTDPANAIISGDEVTLSYTATYDDVTTVTNNASVTIDKIEANGKDKDNYSYTFPTTATGTVNARSSRPSSGGGSGGSGNRFIYGGNQLTISPDNITGQIGSSQQLEATFNVTVTNKDLKWSSSDTGVAVVNEYGKVTLVGTGTAVITAVAVANDEIKDSINVKVIPSASLMDKETVVPYIVGYRDGTFGPENAITREEVATIFTRLLSNKMDPEGSYSTSFNDVAADRWSKDAIGYLESFNILQGYPDGSYRPSNSITRAEMAVIITRAERADLSIATGKTGFNDITNDLYWAETSIKYLADQGILTGYPDGSFAPNKPITRAETVTIINRLLKNMTVENITRTPSDVANDYWAYDDIVKAMNDRIMQ